MDSENHCLRSVMRGSMRTSEHLGICGNKSYVDGDGQYAQFSSPYSIAKDLKNPGFLFLTDPGNKALRQIDTDSLNVSTLIGPNSRSYYGFIQVKLSGDLYMTFDL